MNNRSILHCNTADTGWNEAGVLAVRIRGLKNEGQWWRRAEMWEIHTHTRTHTTCLSRVINFRFLSMLSHHKKHTGYSLHSQEYIFTVWLTRCSWRELQGFFRWGHPQQALVPPSPYCRYWPKHQGQASHGWMLLRADAAQIAASLWEGNSHDEPQAPANSITHSAYRSLLVGAVLKQNKLEWNSHFSPLTPPDSMENFSQICHVTLMTDSFLQLYHEGEWSQKRNHSETGNLTQQHDRGCNLTMYARKKLSNTTAAHKSCLPEGELGFDLITGGKNCSWTCWKVHRREDCCLQSQPNSLTSPATHSSTTATTSMTLGLKSPKESQTKETLKTLQDLLFEIQHLPDPTPILSGEGKL